MLHGLGGSVVSIKNRGVRAIIPGWFMMKGIGELRARGYEETRWRDEHSFIILACEKPRSFRHLDRLRGLLDLSRTGFGPLRHAYSTSYA
jgi:hypothetical protein